MCELLDKYVNKGMEIGRKEGMEAGVERVSELIRHLIGDGRSEEIAHVVSDRDYQNRLLLEYGL